MNNTEDMIEDLNEMKILNGLFDYQKEIKMLEDLISNQERVSSKMKIKDKLNNYDKRTFWKRKSFTQNPYLYLYLNWHYVKTISPYNGETYYKKIYCYNKDVRKKMVRKVRRKLNNCISEDYDIVNQRGKSYKNIYNYKWDRW